MTPSIDSETLRLRLQAVDPPLLLAATSLADFRRARIPGARHFGDLATLLREVPPERSIVVSSSGTDDVTAAWARSLLIEHGYRDVTIHRGGLRAWEAAALPVDTFAPDTNQRRVALADARLVGYHAQEATPKGMHEAEATTMRSQGDPIPLLATKLVAPRVRPDAVRRPRLERLLTAGRLGVLTLVTSPAGFGQSTLVTQWLQHDPAPAVWLTCSPDDDDPRRFFAYSRHSLKTSGHNSATQRR